MRSSSIPLTICLAAILFLTLSASGRQAAAAAPLPASDKPPPTIDVAETAQPAPSSPERERDDSLLTLGEEKALKKLGEEFVSAIRNDNLPAFHTLWLDIGEFEELWKPSPDRQRIARKFLNLRDKAVASMFPIYRRALLDIFEDLDNVQVVTQSATPNTQEGRRVVSFIDVILTSTGGAKVEVRIHDGIYTNHTWRFVELPRGVLFVTDDGKERPVFIDRIATAAESARLDAIRAELQDLKP
jgi:hypothetical protein